MLGSVVVKNDRKKFLCVMFFTAILSIALVLVSIYFLTNKNNNFIKIMIIIFVIFLIIISVFVIWSIVLLSHGVYKGNVNRKNASLLRGALKKIYPILIFVSKILNIDRDTIQRAYCNINNILVENLKMHLNSEDILILLPHCLQNSQCQYKITNDIYNCKMCGKCCIKDIIELTNKYNIETVVATGGTLARSWVKKKKPKAIIAVACERDLTSGINDISKIPVYGVLNIRNNGPCFNTSVNIENLNKAVKLFLKCK